MIRVSLMQRHGSRLPLASEQIYSQNVSDLFKNNTSLLANVSGKYEFLKSESRIDLVLPTSQGGLAEPITRPFACHVLFPFLSRHVRFQSLLTSFFLSLLSKAWTTKQGHDDLTAPGRKQLFDHGVDFNLSYPHLTTDVLLAGYQDRV